MRLHNVFSGIQIVFDVYLKQIQAKFYLLFGRKQSPLSYLTIELYLHGNSLKVLFCLLIKFLFSKFKEEIIAFLPWALL